MTKHVRDDIFSSHGLRQNPGFMPWVATAVASSPDDVGFPCGVLRR
jgi:hypothetical protein